MKTSSVGERRSARGRRRMLEGLLALGVLGAPRAARAQEDNRGAAEALFEEARKLVEAGDFAAACEKLETSERLDAAVGTLLNLARCYEKLGRTATAWATYRDAAALATRSGQQERALAGERMARALEGDLPRLTLSVPKGADVSELTVARDGVRVPPELWGVTVPVDPGEHVLTVSQRGRPERVLEIRLSRGATKRLEIRPARPLQDPADPVASSEAVDPGGLEEPSSARGTQQTVGIALLGAGAVGGAIAVLELLAATTDSVAASPCIGPCTPEGEAARADARSSASAHDTAAWVAGLGGAGCAVLGVYFLSTLPPRSRHPGDVALDPRVDRHGAELSLDVTW